MARLQDFQTVTPTSSDKLLVVQSQGQGLVSYGSKLDTANPTGTGSLSLNRKSGTTTGNQSTALGYNCEASGNVAFAEGNGNVASGSHSHASGFSTIANHGNQFVFGAYNVADPSSAASTARGNYIEVVGKGTADNARSNARTLDWSGNEVLAGGLKINGTTDVGDAIKAVKRYTFNSSSPITIGIYGGAGFVVMGFVQSIGNVILFVSAGTSGIDSVINLLTGQSFSSQYLTFSVSNNVVTISSTNAANSDVTVFAGGRIS